MMRKLFALLLAVMMCAGVLGGCSARSGSVSDVDLPGEGESGEETSAWEGDKPATDDPSSKTVRVLALKGPTAMGMVKLMQDSEDGAAQLGYEFTITTTDDMIPQIAKGDVDIAAIPANLASVLYNNTNGAVQVFAINTLGVLYVVEKGETIQSVGDLRGKTIYTTGKGATPEFSLSYVLNQNGIDPATDVTVEYKSEGAEIVPLLAQSEGGIAFLPQPVVTTALANVEGLRVALDWTKEWDAVSRDGSALITGVMVVRREFAEQFPEEFAVFCAEYAASTSYAQTNVVETAQLVGKYGIADAAVAEQALPACNITYIAGVAMRESLAGYLGVLFEQNPQSIGGALPDDGFYYLP